MGLEKYSEAVIELKAHAALLGWDSDGLELLSDCYWQLGKTLDAREAALRGLKDNPNSVNCLASMSIASSQAELLSTQTADLFAACLESEWGYEVSLDYLLDSEETEKAKTLFKVFQQAHPASELISYYKDQFE